MPRQTRSRHQPMTMRRRCRRGARSAAWSRSPQSQPPASCICRCCAGLPDMPRTHRHPVCSNVHQVAAGNAPCLLHLAFCCVVKRWSRRPRQVLNTTAIEGAERFHAAVLEREPGQGLITVCNHTRCSLCKARPCCCPWVVGPHCHHNLFACADVHHSAASGSLPECAAAASSDFGPHSSSRAQHTPMACACL